MSDYWDQYRNTLRTKRGGWIRGEKIISHGYSLMDDLVGKQSYFQILLMNILGELPERRLADWLEATYSCLSFPDARIWCNQIGALAGTSRALPLDGILPGILASDSTMYGPGTVPDTYKFLTAAKQESQAGLSIEQIVVKRSRRKGSIPVIPGFGRPLATGDERVNRMEVVAKELGYEVGETLQLAYEIEQYLLRYHDESMNLATYTVAFLMDQGFDVIQIQDAGSLMVAAGVVACYMDALEKPPETFLPLRCNDIEYTGPVARAVPESP
jgi:citrate synthase